MKKAKGEQLEAAKKLVAEKIAELGKTKKKLSDDKEDLGLTREQQKADKEFLVKLKLTCNDLDHQFEQRTKTRGQEILAVQETIAILTEDDNADILRSNPVWL